MKPRGTCPHCGSHNVDAEFVDVGVGEVQVTAYECGNCLARQFNYNSDNLSTATEEERKVGWWRGPTETELALSSKDHTSLTHWASYLGFNTVEDLQKHIGLYQND